jgi:hypothetical protein
MSDTLQGLKKQVIDHNPVSSFLANTSFYLLLFFFFFVIDSIMFKCKYDRIQIISE